MTEIGLLMLSVLSTKQTSSAQQRPLPSETKEQKSTKSQSQLVPTTQITPPEFISIEKVATRSLRFSSKPLPLLSFGSYGTSVRVLQRLLVTNGYTIQVDGEFGVLTEVAVRAFQNHRNIGIDGIVGEKTWRELTIN
jgi:peptidoglycan hydrolase-like protein with peptidoglycan-binding domain